VLETVVALGILAILLVVMGALFVRLIGSSNKSGDTSAGLQIADGVLQEAIQSKSFDVVPGDRKIYVYTHDAASPTEFIYRLTSTPTVVTVSVPAQRPIYYMDVHVWWNQPRGTNRLGQGRLEAQTGRLVTP